MLNDLLARRPPVLIVGGVLTILAAGLGSAAPARADQPAPRTERVSYADLNLAHAAGREALQGRIKRAVKRVCRAPGAAPALALRSERVCAQSSLQDAMGQMQRAVRYAELADRS